MKIRYPSGSFIHRTRVGGRSRFGVRLALSLPKGGSVAAFANDPHLPIERPPGTANKAARQSLFPTIWSGYNDYSLTFGVTMKQIRASVFKARCLKIMSEIQSTGEPVVVTKRGARAFGLRRPGARLQEEGSRRATRSWRLASDRRSARPTCWQRPTKSRPRPGAGAGAASRG